MRLIFRAKFTALLAATFCLVLSPPGLHVGGGQSNGVLALSHSAPAHLHHERSSYINVAPGSSGGGGALHKRGAKEQRWYNNHGDGIDAKARVERALAPPPPPPPTPSNDGGNVDGTPPDSPPVADGGSSTSTSTSTSTDGGSSTSASSTTSSSSSSCSTSTSTTSTSSTSSSTVSSTSTNTQHTSTTSTRSPSSTTHTRASTTHRTTSTRRTSTSTSKPTSTKHSTTTTKRRTTSTTTKKLSTSTRKPTSTKKPTPAPTAKPPSGKKWSGRGTFYNPGVNMGACGGWDTKYDMVAAMSHNQWNRGHNCNKRINVCHGGRCQRVRVVDKCMSCKPGDLDLSPTAFKQLARLEQGVIRIDWTFDS